MTMIRGINTLKSNFNVLSEKQKNLAANAANTMTPGYKSQKMMTSTTEQVDIHNFNRTLNGKQRNELGQLTFGNQLDEAVRNFSDGVLKLTESKTDLAINGDAMFTVQNEAGELFYTRNGNFSVNDQGELITQEGYQVLGILDNGATAPINVGTDPAQSFTIDAHGFVNTDTGNGQFLYLTQFENPEDLTSSGGSLFQGGNGVPVGVGFQIEQGYIESSNVDMADVMTEMLQISREFEANQRVLKSTDETLKRATQEVGRT